MDTLGTYFDHKLAQKRIKNKKVSSQTLIEHDWILSWFSNLNTNFISQKIYFQNLHSRKETSSRRVSQARNHDIEKMCDEHKKFACFGQWSAFCYLYLWKNIKNLCDLNFSLFSKYFSTFLSFVKESMNRFWRNFYC